MRVRWTPEQTEELIRRYPHESSRSIADSMGMTREQVTQKAQTENVHKTAEFMAGPQGKKAPRGCLYGAAKQHYVPIGTERIDQYGVLQRKLTDSRSVDSDSRWEPVHRILWEEHLGPVPPGFRLLFKNGDKRDIRIDNIALVSKAEIMRRNTVMRFPAPLRHVMRLAAQVRRQLTEAEK